MGQAMGSNGARSAVLCETSLMQVSLLGPALAGETWDRVSSLPLVTGHQPSLHLLHTHAPCLHPEPWVLCHRGPGSQVRTGGAQGLGQGV